MKRRDFLINSGAVVVTAAGWSALPMVGTATAAETAAPAGFEVTTFTARAGSRSRDVAFTSDGAVWYCGQRDGTLTRLDPADGTLTPVSLGDGAAPHGVTLGPDGMLWVTEGGQNAIARVDPINLDVSLTPLPSGYGRANLNTGVFDHDGVYWFTGQSGVLGRLDPASGAIEAWESPGGPGPYGITVTPGGELWYASLAGSHIARLDRASRRSEMVEPPNPGQGARRVWSDSKGRIWVSEWNSGHVSVHDPADGSWRTWPLPGERPRAYAVYVDELDKVWLTDFGGNAIVRFDPATETFTGFPSDRSGANVRQLAGRPGEVWGGESGTDRLVRIRFKAA